MNPNPNAAAAENPNKVDIGIDEKSRKNIAQGLAHVLADTYTLYLKTHNYHWNVTGPSFRTLHLMFEEQYNALWQAVDLIAERIRTLGYPAPGTCKAFMELSSVKEHEGIPNAPTMVDNLMHDHELTAKRIREIFTGAEKVEDQSTVDLLSERLQHHEKTAWMLRSLSSGGEHIH